MTQRFAARPGGELVAAVDRALIGADVRPGDEVLGDSDGDFPGGSEDEAFLDSGSSSDDRSFERIPNPAATVASRGQQLRVQDARSH
jgi:hypothetical protein